MRRILWAFSPTDCLMPKDAWNLSFAFDPSPGWAESNSSQEPQEGREPHNSNPICRVPNEVVVKSYLVLSEYFSKLICNLFLLKWASASRRPQFTSQNPFFFIWSCKLWIELGTQWACSHVSVSPYDGIQLTYRLVPKKSSLGTEYSRYRICRRENTEGKYLESSQL